MIDGNIWGTAAQMPHLDEITSDAGGVPLPPRTSSRSSALPLRIAAGAADETCLSLTIIDPFQYSRSERTVNEYVNPLCTGLASGQHAHQARVWQRRSSQWD